MFYKVLPTAVMMPNRAGILHAVLFDSYLDIPDLYQGLANETIWFIVGFVYLCQSERALEQLKICTTQNGRGGNALYAHSG